MRHKMRRGDRTQVCHSTHPRERVKQGEIGLMCITVYTPLVGVSQVEVKERGYGLHRGDRTLIELKPLQTFTNRI